jgi:hypothetical protein
MQTIPTASQLDIAPDPHVSHTSSFTMLFSTILLAGSITAANARNVPQPVPRRTTEILFSFWRLGCGVQPCGDGLACAETYPFGEGQRTAPDQCMDAPQEGYQSAELEHLDATNLHWSIDLYSDTACQNFIRVSAQSVESLGNKLTAGLCRTSTPMADMYRRLTNK